MRVVLVTALWVALGSAPPATAQIALPESTDFHNTTDVGDEPEVARLAFYRAEEHLTAGRAKEAGQEIAKLLRGPTRGRVRFGERLVVPLETAALLFLLKLPPEVRTELAREEAELTGAPPRSDDPGALRQFAARHPLLVEGERAWLDAGVRELLRGEFALAASDLERIVHWPLASPGASRPLAAARLLEAAARLRCGTVEGKLAHWPADPAIRAAITRAEEAEQPPVDLPDDGVRSLHVYRSAAQDAMAWGMPLLGGGGPRDPKDALHRSRFLLVQEQDASDEPELKELPLRAPVVAGDRLITLEPLSGDADSPVAIHVRSLTTGQELFEPIRSDFDLHLDPDESHVALDRTALALDGESLYVTLELRDSRQPEQTSHTALFKLDLAREGFIEFRVTSDDLASDPELAGYVLVGPAVVSAGRVLVAASRLRVKETECALLAFDARTGAPGGAIFLARAAAIPRIGERFVADEVRRVNPSPVVVRDGTAFVVTNLGVIAAVRASDLELSWLFRYHRVTTPDPELYERAVLFDLGPWVGRPPIVLADRVLASPADSDYLYSLARWPSVDGWLLLNEPIEKQWRVCLLGADASRCWFLKRTGSTSSDARYSIEATDHDGVPLWTTPDLLFRRITGVVAQTPHWLFVPTDRCIYRVDLRREGSIDRTIAPPKEVGIPYPEFGTFGDLAVVGDVLVSTAQQFTIVMGAAGNGR